MGEAGAKVVYLEERSEDGADDVEWLARVGAEGWVVLTKDQAIRRTRAERDALLNARVRAFFLTSGNLTGEEMATILTGQLSAMTAFARSTAPPFLATVTRAGIRLLPR